MKSGGLHVLFISVRVVRARRNGSGQVRESPVAGQPFCGGGAVFPARMREAFSPNSSRQSGISSLVRVVSASVMILSISRFKSKIENGVTIRNADDRDVFLDNH